MRLLPLALGLAALHGFGCTVIEVTHHHDDAGEGEGDASEGEGEGDLGGDTEDNADACSNGVDDDGDGYTDCADFDCENLGACGGPERDAVACSDGVDDDGDGFTDCDDLGCSHQSVCSGVENGAATCSDGVDDDGDGFVDCADFGCDGVPACSPVETDDATCSDGVDNDGDGARDCGDADCASASVCSGAAGIRIATWNVQQIFGGDPGTGQGQDGLDAVATMLARMAPDVACLNEVHEDDADKLYVLAGQLGYAFVFQSQVSTPMAGGLTNACISKRPFSVAQSRSSNDISSDSHANETGRDFAEVRVDVVPGVKSVTILSAHLKSGFSEADDLRKHIEAVRLAQLVGQVRAERPDDGIVVMGDMNAEITDGPGATFAAPPADMPFSYRLGSDLHYPFTVDVFGAFAGAGLAATQPTHEDDDDLATRIPSGRRIDYQMFSGLTVVDQLVYDPCRDNGVDDGSPGAFLRFPGAPVACGVDEVASDHWPVLADFAP